MTTARTFIIYACVCLAGLAALRIEAAWTEANRAAIWGETE